MLIPNSGGPLIEKRLLNMALILQKTSYLRSMKIQVALEMQQASEPDVFLFIFLTERLFHLPQRSVPNGHVFRILDSFSRTGFFRHIYTRDEEIPNSAFQGQKVITSMCG
jgi:hypothetical protein